MADMINSRSRSLARSRVSTMESPVSHLEAAAPGGEAETRVSSAMSGDNLSCTSPSSVSSFSFSSRLQPGTPPHTSGAQPTVGEYYTATETSSTSKENSSSAKESSFTESEGAVLSPTAQHGGFQSVPLPLPLPPPLPAAVSESHVHSTKTALEYAPGIRDFEYHPKPGDRYIYPAGKSGQEPEQKRRRRSCWLIWTLIVLVAFACGIAVAVTAAVTNPKLPSLAIGDPVFTSLNFTEGSDGEMLKTAMHFTFNLNNPNRHAQVAYSQISATMFYQLLALNNVTNPGFTQGKRTSTALSADLPRKMTIVPPSTVGALKGEIGRSGVDILLRCSATGKFKILGLKIKRFSVPLDCHLRVRPEAPGVPAAVLWPHSCH